MNIQTNPISHYNNTNNVAFKGGIPEKMLRVIPGTKACKNLTPIDIMSFQEYLKFRSQKRIGICAKDIAELSKYEPQSKEYTVAAYELLTKKMGFPQEIRPSLCFSSQIPAGAPMMYVPANNIIYVDSDKLGMFHDNQIFACLRHELQHYIQNINILRHETLAPKGMDFLTKTYIEAQKNSCTDFVKNNSMKALAESGQFSPEHLELLNKTKVCLDKNDIDGFDKLFVGMEKDYRKELESLVAKIRNRLGIIKSDSSLTPKIQQTIKDFQTLGYYKQEDNSIDYRKYFDTFIEGDAIQQQMYAEFEISQKPCFVRYMKEATEAAFKDKQNEKIFKELGITD